MSEILKTKLDQANLVKLEALNNPAIIDFISEYVQLCNPKSVFVRTDAKVDIDYIREKALELGEEKSLKTNGHTIHFDGMLDQARDKKNTCYLIFGDSPLKESVNCIDKEEGIKDVRQILKNIMAQREMYVSFFCLGPADSEFSILAVQITDSSYVCHSEDILYRPGYEQFKKNPDKSDFFKFVAPNTIVGRF